jgi:outer membrane biosynthesis protein TonB
MPDAARHWDRLLGEGRGATLASALAHLALLVVLSLAIRNAPPISEPSDVTAIDFVEIGPVTTSPEAAAAAPPSPPKPLPESETPTPPTAPEPLPLAPAPPPPAKAEAPAPRPVPKPRDTSVQDKAAETPPAERQFDAGALETLIDRSMKTPPAKAAQGRAAQARGKKPGRADARTLASLEAAIRAQIAPCWNPPVGGADVQEMTATFRIRLNRDGSVAALPELVGQTGANDANAAYARTFAETARRAVLRCAPLDLPADLFAEWQEFELNFDPRMLT